MNKRKHSTMEDQPSTSTNLTNLTPISQLTLSLALWTIEAIIFAKTPLRNWNNGRKEGKVINIDIQDDSGKIRIVAFNEFAEQMDSIFNIGDIIRLSKGLLVATNKQWCKLDHPVTINISKYSIFEKILRTNSNIDLKIKFNTIEEILNMETGCTTNLIAIAVLCRNANVSRISDRQPLNKKEVLLLDSTTKKIVLTLWQKTADTFTFKENMIIAVTNATVNEYYNKSITAGNIDINPKNDEAKKLQKWFIGYKKKMPSVSFETIPTDITLLNFITTESIEKGKSFFSKASLIDYQNLIKYQGCEKCSKKIEFLNEQYNCKHCHNVSKNCKDKFMLKILVVDPSKQTWLTLFENQIHQLIQEQKIDPNTLVTKLEKLKNQEFIFKIKCSMYSNGEKKLINYACNQIFHL